MTSEWAIDLSNVTKRFGATVALDKASFRVSAEPFTRFSARTAQGSRQLSSCCRD